MRYKTSISFFFFLACFAFLQAQYGRMYGRIMEEGTKNVVPKAMIVVWDGPAIQRVVASDAAGNYQLPILETRVYHLEVICEGYETLKLVYEPRDGVVDMQDIHIWRKGKGPAEPVEQRIPPLPEPEEGEI
jgi:hypothetical protein